MALWKTGFVIALGLFVCAPIAGAGVSSPAEIAAAGLNAEELAMYEYVGDHIGVESFASVPWHMKKMLSIIAIKAASGELDGKRVPAYCFDGNIPSDVAEYMNMAYYGGAGTKFNEIQDRWTSTASGGTINSQGGPAVITYSFVPDGMTIPGDSSIIDTQTSSPMADGNSNLRSFLTGIYGDEATWLQLFQQVFDDWSAKTGITYVYEPNDDGAAFPDSGGPSGASGVVGVRGDVRIAGIRIDGEVGGNILAFNFFPNAGDMVIDTSNASFYGSVSNNSRRLRNVVAHEHGHGIGMPHTCPTDFTKLMEPSITTSFDGVQPDDRLSGQRTYGDPNEKSVGNDTRVDATDLGTIDDTSSSANSVSIDDDSDVDFYEFTMTTASDVTVTLTPIGSTYPSGVQLSGGACSAGAAFNALTVANLNVELIGTNGNTVLSSGDVTAAGVAEVITDFNLAAPGTYFVRVFQAAIANNVQGYNLSVAAVDAGPPAPVANFSADVTTGTAPLTVTFTDTSTESPTSWAWDFENNGSTDSTAQNPSHVYSTPGVYTVKLTATSANGSDDEIKANFITITLLETTIDVTGGSWAEEGENVTFTAGPSGAVGYQWYKDGNALGGETNATLDLVSVVIADSGDYYCEVTTAAKGIANTETVAFLVFPVGVLPTGTWAGIVALLMALSVAAALVVRRARGAT